MSRYQEICSALVKASNVYYDNYDECAKFSNALREGLAQYLGCSIDFINFIPTIDEPQTGMIYTAQGALKFGDDGFFHIGLGIVIDPSISSQKWLPQRLLLRLLIKKDDSNFIVILKGNNKEIKSNYRQCRSFI